MNVPFRWPRISLRAGAPFIVIVLVLALVAALAIQPTRQLLDQKERIAGMTADLRQLQRANALLSRRIERLQDPDFIEQRAREQIGLVRPGETAFVVMPPSKRRKPRRDKRASRATAAPPEPSFAEGLLNFLGF